MRPHVAPYLRLLAVLGIASLTAACGVWPFKAARGRALPTHVALAASRTGGSPAAAQTSGAGMPAARILPAPLPGLDIHSAAFPAGIGFLAAWSGGGCYGEAGSCTGRVLRSTDGGHTWIAVYSTHGFLRGLSFPDPVRGWALGGTCNPDAPAAGCTSTLLATADGGVDWTPVYSRTDALLAEVDFVNAQRGWLSLQTGGLLRSTDGGRTWIAVAAPCAASPQEPKLGSFSFTGPQSGFAVCESPEAGVTVAKVLFRTTNGGESWQSMQAAIPTGGGVVDMAFSSARTGWLCTWPVGGPLLVTRDGGNVWSPAAGQLGGANLVALAVVPVHPADIYVVVGLGPTAAVLRSVDGGQTWSGVYPATGPFLGAGGGPAVQFVGPRVGYGVGVPADPSAVFRTSDGGVSWRPVGHLPPNAALINWSFAAPDVGWAIVSQAGGPPKLLATQNAGQSWTTVTGAPGMPELAVRQSAADGLLVSGATLFRTLDAGRHFAAIGTARGISGLAMPLNGNGWAIVRGALERSADGGRTWLPASVLPKGYEALTLSFPDGNHGWVLTAQACDGPGACAQALWATADGGRTWTALALGRLDAAAVDFTTPANGWLTTANGTLYRSTDGGRTWQGLD